MDPKAVKDLAFAIKKELNNMLLVIAHTHEGKPGITVMISESVVAPHDLHAGHMVRDLARHFQGGGGGQPFFATAGGKDPKGLTQALEDSRKRVESL